MRAAALFLTFGALLACASAVSLQSSMQALSPSVPPKDVSADIEAGLSELRGRVDTITGTCKSELDKLANAPKIAAGNEDADKAMRDALAGRVNGLKRLIEQLEKYYARLGTHIMRVNRIYKVKHDESLLTMQEATEALQQLGFAVHTQTNPGDDPIKFTGSVSTEAPAADPTEDALEGADLATVEFLEIDVDVDTVFGRAKAAVVSLYNKALKDARVNKHYFEQDRKAIAAFRKKLRELIEAKKARLKELEDLLNGAEKVFGAGEGSAAAIRSLWEAHRVEIEKTCHEFDDKAEVGKEDLADAEEDLGATAGPEPEPQLQVEAVPDAPLEEEPEEPVEEDESSEVQSELRQILSSKLD
eukprot:PLAT15338.1.p2 GENE.PLAT15338.1~~PLAT15338.1.p2  ORF type:complete len:359 (+),score=167.43 PLAT15338.1:71-1147(+)